MKKAIIFDLDGTLINSLADISAAMNKVLVSCDISPHPQEKYNLFTGDGAKNLTLRAMGEHGKNKELFETVYQMYTKEYSANSRINTAPYLGIPELLQDLSRAGLKICVLSNKGDADVKAVVKYYFPNQEFAYVGGVREGGPVKPDPRTALEVIQALQIPAEEFWYVGDTATDMRCAAGAGIESIGVGWGFQSKEMIEAASPTYFVESVQQLRLMILDDALFL